MAPFGAAPCHVAGADRLRRPAPFLNIAVSARDDQRLPQGMRMPCGTRSRLEGDGCTAIQRRHRAWQATLHLDLASEMIRRSQVRWVGVGLDDQDALPIRSRPSRPAPGVSLHPAVVRFSLALMARTPPFFALNSAARGFMRVGRRRRTQVGRMASQSRRLGIHNLGHKLSQSWPW